MGNYLNCFDYNTCKSIIRKISNLDFMNTGLNPIVFNCDPKPKTDEITILVYYPELHRIDMYNKRLDEPVYCNPDVITNMMSEKIFIKNIYLNNDYFNLIISDNKGRI